MGRRDRIPEELRAKMDELETATRELTRLDLWIAFDYGSRAEIAEAARRIVEDGIAADEVDEAAVAERLQAPDLPDPDILLRASGERRISNFLLWQCAYSELIFTDTLWPDFGEDDLRRALDEYARRERRYGGR